MPMRAVIPTMTPPPSPSMPRSSCCGARAATSRSSRCPSTAPTADGWAVQRFAPAPAAVETVLALGDRDRAMKRQMFAAHRTQAGTLAFFDAETERFRIAPAYDFRDPAERRPSALRAPRLGHDRRPVGPPGRGGIARARAGANLVTLTILSVAYPLAPVGIDAGGGAEQVLTALDRALVAAGHRSLVVACAGSSAFGQLIEVSREGGLLDEAARERAWARHRAAIAAALAPLAGRPRPHARHRFRRLSAGARRAGARDAASAAELVSAGGAAAEAARHLAELRLRGAARGLSFDAEPPGADRERRRRRGARGAARQARLCARRLPHLPGEGRASRDRGRQGGRRDAPHRRRGVGLRGAPALFRRGGRAAARSPAPLHRAGRLRPQAPPHDRGALPARAVDGGGNQLARRPRGARLRHPGDRLPERRSAGNDRPWPDGVPRRRTSTRWRRRSGARRLSTRKRAAGPRASASASRQ